MANEGQFDGKSKPWTRKRPFHRVGSTKGEVPPAFDPAASQVSGFGYGRGCWSSGVDGPKDSLFSKLISDLIRAVPGWVTVNRTEEIKEIEGPLARSFQTWTDVPVYQWHRWYDWNFHVVPIDGYKYLRGKGNYPGELESGRQLVVVGDTMECEWDTGSISRFSEAADRRSPQPMEFRGPMFRADWAWPQTGQYFWTTGRWIYDCGHPMRNPGEKGPDGNFLPDHPSRVKEDGSEDRKTDPSPGLHASELHPCRAIATVRFEAHKFKENKLLVPAVQFMFFASRLGGYHTYPEIASDDYTFIVDLPKTDAASPVWTIGHTTDFPLNTAVLRTRRWLVDFDYSPFEAVYGSFPHVDPIVEEIRKDDAGPLAPPEQVRVTIPLKSKVSAGLSNFGVIVSLGWEDPDLALARKVRRVTVKMKDIKVGDDNHESFLNDIGGGRWVMKYCVNGRWKMAIFPNVDEEQSLPLGDQFVFHLSEEDPIRVSIHGMEQDGVGNYLERNSETERILFFRNKLIDYERDVLTANANMARQLTIRIGEVTASSLGNQNDPLGLADFVEIAGKIPEGKPQNRRLKAHRTDEVAGTAVLFETATEDYSLNYTVQVDPQAGLPS
jgi:hypothetical protein